MGVITGRLVGASGPTALPVPAVGQVVENVTALRALAGSADLPAVTLLQYSGTTRIGGGVFEWQDTAATDDSGHRFNAGGHGTSGAGWQRVGVTPGEYRSENFGVVADGSTNDDTALARWYAAGQGNLMLLQAGTVVTTTGLPTVDTARTNIVGQGKQNTVIQLNPDVPGRVAVEFSAGAGVLYQCGIGGVSFSSGNTTDHKVAIRATDTSELSIETIAMLNWTGNTSVGIQLQGRELTTIRDVSIQADRPIAIEVNPNSAIISSDHLSITDAYLLPLSATGGGIHFDGDFVNAFNTKIDRVACVGGKYGIYWPIADIGDQSVVSIGFSVKNFRWEQAASAAGYAIHMSHRLFETSISDALLSNTNGVYLRWSSFVSIRDSIFEGVGGTVALDIDSASHVNLWNFFRQVGSSSNWGADLRQIFAAPGYATSGPIHELRSYNGASHPTLQSFGALAPGSVEIDSGYWHIQYQRLQLTGTQRLTLAGTARYILTDL